MALKRTLFTVSIPRDWGDTKADCELTDLRIALHSQFPAYSVPMRPSIADGWAALVVEHGDKAPHPERLSGWGHGLLVIEEVK